MARDELRNLAPIMGCSFIPVRAVAGWVSRRMSLLPPPTGLPIVRQFHEASGDAARGLAAAATLRALNTTQDASIDRQERPTHFNTDGQRRRPSKGRGTCSSCSPTIEMGRSVCVAVNMERPTRAERGRRSIVSGHPLRTHRVDRHRRPSRFGDSLVARLYGSDLIRLAAMV
jgi:hypothetical protein